MFCQVSVGLIHKKSGSADAMESVIVNYVNNADKLWANQLQLLNERDAILINRMNSIQVNCLHPGGMNQFSIAEKNIKNIVFQKLLLFSLIYLIVVVNKSDYNYMESSCMNIVFWHFADWNMATRWRDVHPNLILFFTDDQNSSSFSCIPLQVLIILKSWCPCYRQLIFVHLFTKVSTHTSFLCSGIGWCMKLWKSLRNQFTEVEIQTFYETNLVWFH